MLSEVNQRFGAEEDSNSESGVSNVSVTIIQRSQIPRLPEMP